MNGYLNESVKIPRYTAAGISLRGTLKNRRRRFKKGLEDCRRAVDIFATMADPWNPEFIRHHECVGEALLGLGDPAGARKALEPAITPKLDLEKGPQWTAGAKLQLARALWATGDKARAVELAHAAHRSLIDAEGDNSRMIGLLEAWLRKHPAPKHEATTAAN